MKLSVRVVMAVCHVIYGNFIFCSFFELNIGLQRLGQTFLYSPEVGQHIHVFNIAL